MGTVGNAGSTRRKVHDLLEQGLSSAEVAKALGVSKSTVCFHRRRLGFEIDERCNRRYDWAAIQAYYEGGRSKRECQQAFGFSSHSWHDAVKRGDIVPRAQLRAIESYLVIGRVNRYHLKRRLVADRIKEYRCECCGVADWRGRPLSLDLHHVNGDRLDNRLENLQILCPNCHAQTPNFGVRNRGVRRSGRQAS